MRISKTDLPLNTVNILSDKIKTLKKSTADFPIEAKAK